MELIIFGSRYSLSLNSKELTDITKSILNEVLPRLPKKIFTQLLLALIKFEFGSFAIIALQVFKKSFYMERHLDSSIILQLCHDKILLKKLTEYLGEDLVLWRSELWLNYPSDQLIPFWHQDSYPKLLKGDGKTIHAYIALTEVNEYNGFEYLPNIYLEDCPIKVTDPFSGNHFFEIPDEIAKKAIPVVLRPGEFVLFTDNLVHRSIRNKSGKVRLSLTLRLTQPGVKVLPGYTSGGDTEVMISLKPLLQL